MEKISQVDHSNSMENQYNVTDPVKSGFNLTYNTHPAGLVIGRLYPQTYQHIMPSDKFSGRNQFSLIAEQLSTPVVSPVNVSQHNYFVTYRSIDKGFEDLLTPTKLNGMSASLSVPTFSLAKVAKEILKEFFSGIIKLSRSNTSSIWQISTTASDWNGFALAVFNALDNGAFRSAAAKFYMDDVYDDLKEQLRSVLLSMETSPTRAKLESIFMMVFDFFCGEGSMMDYLGYPIIKHSDISSWFTQWLSDYRLYGTSLSGSNTLEAIVADYSATQNVWDLILSPMQGVTDTTWQIDKREVSEYPLRAMYAIWFEYYRVNELEPRSNDLWEYHDFGSTSLFTLDSDKFVGCLLPLRARCWTKDPFTTAQIDDICRHVYAPIMYNPVSNRPSYSSPSIPAQNNINADASVAGNGNILSGITISYIDTSGVNKSINCPIPDALSSMDYNYIYNANAISLGLDLFTLKKAKMLENYLKRNLCFGDEYRDRMKAHYNVTIEDYRINRPAYLSGSVSELDVKQEVANTGALAGQGSTMAEQGSRLATATVSTGDASDGFEFFATEFGIYIGVLSIVPRAQYDHTCPQLFMTKTADFPTPEFAMQQEDIMNSAEIYRNGFINTASDNKPFGHVPYAHPYRYRVDEVHGQSLSSKFDYTFCRFYKGLTNDGTPKLNYKFIHCRPNLPMFVNSILLDGQFYGTSKHNFLVERLLPQPVETI